MRVNRITVKYTLPHPFNLSARSLPGDHTNTALLMGILDLQPIIRETRDNASR